MAMNNSSLLPINHQITYGDIDWIYTKQWINSNPFDMPTSSKLSKIQSNRLKKSTFTYPTGNILQRNYPNLYPLGRIHCTECSIDEDTNAHIGLCPSHRQSITSLLTKFKKNLIDLLRNEGTSNLSFDIESRVNNSNMFKVLPDVLDVARLLDTTDHLCIPREQPWILLLHHLIPRDLAVFFDNYFSKAAERSRFLIQYVTDFISELTTITWSSRSRSFKKWEKSLDITLKKKKNYRKHTGITSARASSSATTSPPNVTHKRRNRYTRYYHNKVLPYYKEKVTFDVSACIRWTTCNFLHSGSWESYRDNLLFNLDNFSPVQSFLDSLRPHIT
ncbi:hypothetical protein GLOIN_2v1763333 [Rhizophagus irregularis DAOM 181602=DAOM 197198]|nr:hypothetical protein GLOIN_2v1763333 [Rhizophagus irregularis DAOM 181602=DAOM 197198]